MLGLLGLRVFEATGADITDLSEIHGHRVLHVHGKGDKVVDVPLPPAVGRAIDRAVAGRSGGPILRTRTGSRMDRHCATRRLQALAKTAGVNGTRMHPHMLRHTYVTTMLDAGVDLRDVQIAARHADPRTTMRYDRARNNLDRHANYILAAFMAAQHLTHPHRGRSAWPHAHAMRHERTRVADRPRSDCSASEPAGHGEPPRFVSHSPSPVAREARCPFGLGLPTNQAATASAATMSRTMIPVHMGTTSLSEVLALGSRPVDPRY
jgi:Phage integrase family